MQYLGVIMVTDRARIQSYFADTEEKAIQQYADKHRLTLSKAVEALVKKGLNDSSETPEALIHATELEKALQQLEKAQEENTSLMIKWAEKIEKLDYQICCLQEDYSNVKRELNKKRIKEYSDDQIEAMTHQRVQTVIEWRHGLRKPRGERILKALEGIEVVEGKWIRQG